MPALTDTTLTFREAEQRARNAEETLLAALNAIIRTTARTIIPDWTDLFSAGNLMHRLRRQDSAYLAIGPRCLSYLVLAGQKLQFQDLHSGDLANADLTGANLTGANLMDADLRGANLTGANLRKADLTGADLTGANPTDADLTGADLRKADLTATNLRRVNFTAANLVGVLGRTVKKR
jgi:uncharacterized protein YjbI with pentapeptide repeats